MFVDDLKTFLVTVERFNDKYDGEFVLGKDDSYSARREFLNLRELCIEASRVGTGLISFG